MSALAAELVDLGVAVLFSAGGTPTALAAKAATQTIPIVFSAVTDAIHSGLVMSLNRPGGNLTGTSIFTLDVAVKSAQFLKELLPAATAFAYLLNPTSPGAELYAKEAVSAASALGIEVHVLGASTEHELDVALASARKLGLGGVVVPGEPFFHSRRDTIVAPAARYTVPAVYAFREYALAGGLMSYGSAPATAVRHSFTLPTRVGSGITDPLLPRRD